MKKILGDNPFFGVNHSKTSSVDFNNRLDEFAGTIDYAAEKLGISEMMISPHFGYSDLLVRVKCKIDLTVLIPMPQDINKKVAINGLTYLIRHYFKELSYCLFKSNLLIKIFFNMIKFKNFRYQIFYIFFYIEAMKVLRELGAVDVTILNFGLHNLLTDMLIASKNLQAFDAFVTVCKDLKRGHVIVTQNIPRILKILSERDADIQYTVCGSVNQLEYMTNPSLSEVLKSVEERPDNVTVWAMQILASGAVSPSELDPELFAHFDAVLIASRKQSRLKELSDALSV